MKGYLDAKELESYKKEDLQELAKQLGVDAEGTKKEIATRCAAVEVDIPDEGAKDRTKYGYWPSVFRLSIPAAICGPAGFQMRAGGAPYAGQWASICGPASFSGNEDTKNRIPFLSKGDPASMIRLYVVDNLQSRKASYQMLCTITLECKTTSTPI